MFKYLIKLFHTLYYRIYFSIFGFPKKKDIKEERNVKLHKKEVHDFLEKECKTGNYNIYTRNQNKTCKELYEYEKAKYQKNKKEKEFKLPAKIQCYGCRKIIDVSHGIYVFSCSKCGDKFMKHRHFETSQHNKVSLVIGARTKLGHQIVIKLLRAGATVIGTTRSPQEMKTLFSLYKENWIKNLDVFPEPLDLDDSDIETRLNSLHSYIQSKYNRLDILINSAAQTIRSREKDKEFRDRDSNRYREPKHVDKKLKNSWTFDIQDLEQKEMEEIFRINAIAPTLIIKKFIPLMKRSKFVPYIINVHAREGLIKVGKSDKHIHTNMGKSALHMLTKCLCSAELTTKLGKKFSIHGCCPGFISIDEYYEYNKPFPFAPLDEIDGASRILYPLFMGFRSQSSTRRHYDQLIF